MKKLLAVIFLVSTFGAQAANLACKGTPTEVFTWKGGMIGVKLKLDTEDKVWVLCDSSDLGCDGVLSNLLTAKAAKSSIAVIFSDTNYEVCTAFDSWKDHSEDFQYIRQYES